MKLTKLNDETRVKVVAFKPKIDLIKRVIAEHDQVTIADIDHHRRFLKAVGARQEVQYFARYFLPHCPFAIIGYLTGNGRAYDHASVCNNIKKVNNMLSLRHRDGRAVYPEYVQKIDALKFIITREMQHDMDYFARTVGNAYN